MSAVLEKAARALCKARAVRSGLADDHADYVAGEKWPEWIGEARAVLLAIREPDEAMLQPGCTKHKPGVPMSDDRREECPTFFRRRKVWASMIDAILAGETET